MYDKEHYSLFNQAEALLDYLISLYSKMIYEEKDNPQSDRELISRLFEERSDIQDDADLLSPSTPHSFVRRNSALQSASVCTKKNGIYHMKSKSSIQYEGTMTELELGRSTSSVDSAISFVLEENFKSFRNDPTAQDSLGAFEELKGAAKLALDVAMLAKINTLKSQAQQILSWLVEFEDQTDAAYEQQRQQDFAEYDAYQRNNRETYKLIRAFIGQELENHRWRALVDSYSVEFPTFQIANSVWERISPKSLSSALCKILRELIKSKHPDRIPSIEELESTLPEAMLIFDSYTLRYLNKALPGLNFSELLIKQSGSR